MAVARMLVADAWVVASTILLLLPMGPLVIPLVALSENNAPLEEEIDPRRSWMPHTVLCLPSMTLHVAPP